MRTSHGRALSLLAVFAAGTLFTWSQDQPSQTTSRALSSGGSLEILSDTRGVDFGPYLKQLKVVVQKHWDPLVPEVARPPIMKKGMLVVQFYIMKDGSIKGMRLIKSSGDRSSGRGCLGRCHFVDPA